MASSRPSQGTRRYRVLHVLDSFDLGGAQEAVLQIVSRLPRERFANEVATLHGRGLFWEKFRALGIPTHSLSPNKSLPLYVPNLIGLMVKRRYDVVHCHLIASNLIAKPLAALCGVKVRINHDQSNDAYRAAGGLRMHLDWLANRFSTHVCAVSASTRAFLVQREGLDPARVSLVYNGTDPNRFRKSDSGERKAARRRYGLPESGPVVGGIGRLNPQKNFLLFLEVAARLRQRYSDAAFVLAGKGPERRVLEARAASLGLRDAVRFVGLVPDMTKLYPAIDLLLMPSLFEGLPLALLEAMASEIPAVASAVDGIAEILENGKDGVLVESGDDEGFATAVLGLLGDGEKAAAIGRAARRKVEARFSCDVMARAIEEIYLRYLP